jgi:UDPglucose--hexose-1-phosphate uridylyltransferase
VILETDAFTWLAPHASKFAHQQWLIPKQHANEPGDAAGLGAMLQASARAMSGVASAYNWSFVTFRHEPRAHWYVDLFPRMTTVAGFELGTGTFIEIVDPAATARAFRT